VVAVAMMTLVCQDSRLFSPASWLDRYFERPDLKERLKKIKFTIKKLDFYLSKRLSYCSVASERANPPPRRMMTPHGSFFSTEVER
jgi:hypothetical protein